jgi:hypothetical protein
MTKQYVTMQYVTGQNRLIQLDDSCDENQCFSDTKMDFMQSRKVNLRRGGLVRIPDRRCSGRNMRLEKIQRKIHSVERVPPVSLS